MALISKPEAPAEAARATLLLDDAEASLGWLVVRLRGALAEARRSRRGESARPESARPESARPEAARGRFGSAVRADSVAAPCALADPTTITEANRQDEISHDMSKTEQVQRAGARRSCCQPTSVSSHFDKKLGIGG